MKIGTEFEVDVAHQLTLPYKSKCCSIHGHRLKICVEMEGTIGEHGMVVDFAKIKDAIKIDHTLLNDILPQPTSERIVEFIGKVLLETVGENVFTITVKVYETPTNWAEKTFVKER